MNITLKRLNDAYHFVGTNEDGCEVHIDGSAEIGGENKGMRPMQLLLTSVGACSVFDVVAILKKQRQPVEDIRVEMSGNRKENAVPKPFTDIHLTFFVKGDVDKGKLDRAVSLAVEKYCSVGSSLDPRITITYEAKLV